MLIYKYKTQFFRCIDEISQRGTIRFLQFWSQLIIYGAFIFCCCNNAYADFKHEDANKITLQYILKIENLAKSEKLTSILLEKSKSLQSLLEVIKADKAWQTNKPQNPPRFNDQATNQLLLKFVEENPAISEIIITDAIGATVFSEPITSDYWQADEKKFKEPAATSATFIGKIDFDNSTNTFAIQISAPIYSQALFLGVIVVGIEMPISVIMELPVGKSPKN